MWSIFRIGSAYLVCWNAVHVGNGIRTGQIIVTGDGSCTNIETSGDHQTLHDFGSWELEFEQVV